MIKFIFTLAFVIFTGAAIFAQNIPFSIVKSDLFKDEHSNTYILHAEDDKDGGSFLVRGFETSVMPMPEGYTFEYYDNNMRLLKEYKYEGKGNILGIIVKGGAVSVIEVDYSKERKSFIWTAYTASTADFIFTPKEIYSFESKNVNLYRYSPTTGEMNPAFEMFVNEENSAFAVVVDIRGKEDRNEIHLFNSSLQKKFSHSISPKCCFRSFNYKNLNVSPDGNSIYLISKVYTSETKNKDKGGGYQYELTKLTASGAETQVFSTEEHFISEMYSVAIENKIFCIGLYSDKDDFRSKGVCHFEVNSSDMEIKSKKFNPFTEQFLIDKYGKVKDKKIKYLVLKNVVVLPSGEIVFDAQEEYKEEIRKSGNTHTSNKSHFDDIVNIKLDKSGDIIYARNINKRQSSGLSNSAYLSYTSAVKNGSTYFLFNTGAGVREISGGRIEFNQAVLKNLSNLNIVWVNINGEFDYQSLTDEDKDNVVFEAGYGIATKNSMYLIGKAKGKHRQILKVNLN